MINLLKSFYVLFTFYLFQSIQNVTQVSLWDWIYSALPPMYNYLVNATINFFAKWLSLFEFKFGAIADVFPSLYCALFGLNIILAASVYAVLVLTVILLAYDLLSFCWNTFCFSTLHIKLFFNAKFLSITYVKPSPFLFKINFIGLALGETINIIAYIWVYFMDNFLAIWLSYTIQLVLMFLIYPPILNVCLATSYLFIIFFLYIKHLKLYYEQLLICCGVLDKKINLCPRKDFFNNNFYGLKSLFASVRIRKTNILVRVAYILNIVHYVLSAIFIILLFSVCCFFLFKIII